MNYKYFSVIHKGDLFGDDKDAIDIAATHRNRDGVLIDRCKVMSEMLAAGMADPGRVGRDMLELVNEAEKIEKDIGFIYGDEDERY